MVWRAMTLAELSLDEDEARHSVVNEHRKEKRLSILRNDR